MIFLALRQPTEKLKAAYFFGAESSLYLSALLRCFFYISFDFYYD
jgi:hypothetical protein